MDAAFGDVQRIVLHGYPWRVARHLMISFGSGARCRLLRLLLGHVSAVGSSSRPPVQCSVGLTRRGLERAGVPRNVMSRLALKAPAFWSGAALRAAGHLGLTGRSAPERWNAVFGLTTLDLVFSLHGDDEPSVNEEFVKIEAICAQQHIQFEELPLARALEPPPAQREFAGKEKGETRRAPQWVHFGYRDSLSRIGIRGWTRPETLGELRDPSIHEPGEFVLGHVADSGAATWVAGPGLRVWPRTVRAFFHNASFGVLHQMVQDVEAFESFVRKAAEQLREPSVANGDPRDPEREVKGKLCGRYPEGQPLAVPGDEGDPEADFDYSQDPDGTGCPFGSHVRRMNPRLHRPPGSLTAPEPAGAAHFSRARPLLRRGMPYGPQWLAASANGTSGGAGPERGLIGHFFCASIEDQFEHLQGEWADRVPLGSSDGGGARDPLIGAHEVRDGPFEIPQPGGALPRQLRGLQAFVHTAGAAYLFYPSLTTLRRIADSELWREVEDEV
jgi:hypothetical protein